jgi:hypothetical protein
MISNHLSLIELQRRNAGSIDDQITKYLQKGGRVVHLEAPPFNPIRPPRSTRIDPETILKRKRKSQPHVKRRTRRKAVDTP